MYKFNLQRALAGDQVITGENHKVLQILRFDEKYDLPFSLIAVIQLPENYCTTNSPKCYVRVFSDNGHYLHNAPPQYSLFMQDDLFMEKMTNADA